jgi:hypothetical protein
LRNRTEPVLLAAIIHSARARLVGHGFFKARLDLASRVLPNQKKC